MIWDHSLIEIQFENLDSVTLKGGREAIFYDGKSKPLGNKTSFLEHGVLAIKPNGIVYKFIQCSAWVEQREQIT